MFVFSVLSSLGTNPNKSTSIVLSYLPTYLCGYTPCGYVQNKKYLNGNGSIFQFKLLRIYEVMFEEQNNVGTKGNLKHKVDLVKPS